MKIDIHEIHKTMSIMVNDSKFKTRKIKNAFKKLGEKTKDNHGYMYSLEIKTEYGPLKMLFFDLQWICKFCENYAGLNYMVTDNLWKKLGFKNNDLVCLGCLRKKIKRKFKKSDFIDVPINTGIRAVL